MDRDLKPPYVPPKDKVISDAEISKQEHVGKNVIDEIKVCLCIKPQAELGGTAYNPQKAKDPKWDQEF